MAQVKWELLHPRMTYDHLGFLPAWLDDSSPRSAREQLDDGYKFAGGWSPFQGFVLGSDNSLKYPGDPPQQVLAEARLRDELICFYASSWVAIIQKDRTFEVCRMD